MSNHLPECASAQEEATANAGGWDYGWPCICERLRAREARKDAEHADCRCNELEAVAIVDGRYESIAINGQLLERRDVVLREAREAVAAVPNVVDVFGSAYVNRVDTLVAIDALISSEINNAREQ